MFVPQPDPRNCTASTLRNDENQALQLSYYTVIYGYFLDADSRRVKENFILQRAWDGAMRVMLNRRISEAQPDAGVAATGGTGEP